MNTNPSCVFNTGSLVDGKWIVIELIGKGGMGEVYRAHQINLKRDVAIKVISEELLAAAEDNPDEVSGALGRFQREVQVMAQVHHPNVLQIFDYGSAEAPDDYQKKITMEYIAMEYVPGETLRYTMSEQGFGDEETLLTDWLKRFFIPVLDGVEAIHALGIVHRDLKPENILMDGDIPKIADFGLARSTRMRAVSNSWDVKGTMSYMAPEQFEDFRRSGPEADIYALGKILFEAVAGKLDPQRVPFKEVLLESTDTPLLAAIDGIIRKATAEDKSQRYPTITELRRAVQDALRSATATGAASINPLATTAAIRWIWAGVATVLLAVLGMTAYHLWFQSVPSGGHGEIVSLEHPVVQPAPSSAPLKTTLLAMDGQPMILVEGKEGLPAFYLDRTLVSYHSFHEFLNAMAAKVVVKDGVVKYQDDIWAYLGDGTAPYEQIAYQNNRFILRDAALASHAVVRVTFLGAQAYARHYNKSLPSLPQWRAGLALLNAETRQAPAKTASPATDSHSRMMHGPENSLSGSRAARLDEQPAIKEWVADVMIRDAAAPGHASGDTASLVVAWPQSESDPPQKQYPWEGFADVGFRTVMVPAP